MPGQSTIAGIPVTLRDPKDDPGQEGKLPPGKKPRVAADKTGPPPSRSSLRWSAGWWRSLQYIGMSMHFLAPPRPPNPAFTKTAHATISSKKGKIKLQFYIPQDYFHRDKKHARYPAVINFHGGGFTLGSGTDDARFARFVVEQCNAVFISVDYRLAPEYPFPVPVEDGADALLYVIRNAADLRVDPFRLSTSGFSAGGNIAITAPLRLKAYINSLPNSAEPVPYHRIIAVATWYPITDYTITRAERRATSIKPNKALPSTFTDLFDASYLFPPDLDLADPFLSPSRASDQLLSEAIPPNVIFYTCEWDMLLKEGEALAKRLGNPPINKKVYYRMIPGVPHAWDKEPSPLAPPEGSEELYRECCQKLKEIIESSQDRY